ncbi:MAG TPA: hypothetical protein VF164_10100 [Trueperaceae bacterium]|jgi:phenylacetate-coenzyme A ligase PaaK-like adenylate-forming protein
MDARLIARVLASRRRLLRRDGWDRSRLEAHQAQALHALREYAASRSSFYQRYHRGLAGKPLSELPVLTKGMLMDSFDRLVTDPRVRLHALEAHLAERVGEPFLGRYRVNATSGTTGRRGVFLFDAREWAFVLASYARAYAWAGVMPGPTRRVPTAVVSTTKPWHQSAAVGASVQSRFMPTLRLDATAPLEALTERLNAFQPEALIAYASTLRLLADAQLAGALAIAPRAVLSASEALTPETRRLIGRAWGLEPFDVYAATETATIAAECEHRRPHLFEDLVIAEVVDEAGRPVPVGEHGAKVLVTVLFGRTLPLIRYEMSDSVSLAAGSCPCGRPYALLAGIMGRREEVLRLRAARGGWVEVHPNVFHDVIDLLPTGGWQVSLGPEGLAVLLVGAGGVDDARLVAALEVALAGRGAAPLPVTVRRVAEIPKTAVGKAPLVTSQPLERQPS